MIKFILTHSIIAIGILIAHRLFKRRNERLFKETHYKYMIDCFKEQNKYINEVDVLFVGASITEVYMINDFYKSNCVNRGISSDTTEGLLGRMDCSLFELNPKKIIMVFGSNDLALGALKEQVIINYKNIINQIKVNLPYTDIYIQSVYLVHKKKHKKINKAMVRKRTNSDFDALNNMISTVCKEEGITYIDVNSVLKDDTGNLNINYSTDGLHLNSKGYEIVTSVLNEYIE